MPQILSDAKKMQRFNKPQRQGALFPGSAGVGFAVSTCVKLLLTLMKCSVLKCHSGRERCSLAAWAWICCFYMPIILSDANDMRRFEMPQQQAAASPGSVPV